MNTGQLDEEATRQLVGGEPYVLRDVPIEKVGGVRGARAISRDRVKEYAGMEAGTQPPIVIDGEGRPIDGKHRVAASKVRGDETIRAYVPKAWAEEHMPEPAPAAEEPAAPRLAGGKRAGAVAVPEAAAKAMEGLAERDVRPLTERMKQGISSISRTIGSALGTDAFRGIAGRRVANDLRKLQGQADLARVRLEERMRPSIEAAEGMKEEGAAALVDQLEGPEMPVDERFHEGAKVLRELNGQNRQRAMALGMPRSENWNENWVGRLFRFGKAHGAGGGGSLAGSEKFKFGRDFETYSDALKAVREQGGEPLYDNPMKMALAKELEVMRSLDAQELYQKELKRGTIKDMTGKPLPDGWKYIDDRLASPGGRRWAIHPADQKLVNDSSLPVDQRIANFKNLMEKGRLTEVRPKEKGVKEIYQPHETGEATGQYAPKGQFPAGMVPADEAISRLGDKRHYAAPSAVSELLDHHINENLHRGALTESLSTINHLASLSELALSGYHAFSVPLGISGNMFGQGVRDLRRGNVGGAARSFAASIPFAGLPRVIGEGLRAGEQMKRPEFLPGGAKAENRAQAVAVSGEPTKIPTLLKPSDWRAARQEFTAGNPIGATARLARMTAQSVNDLIMKKWVPTLIRGAMSLHAASEIENAMKRGEELDSDKFTDSMVKHQKNLHDIVGETPRRSQFQNPIARNIADITMFAGDWTLGKLRWHGRALRDLAGPLHGQEIGPSALSMLGAVAATAGVGSWMNYMLNGKPPKSMEDVLHPPTPFKHADGSPVRIRFPVPWEKDIQLLEGESPVKIAYNSLGAPVHTLAEQLRGVDWRGVKLDSIGARAKAAGRSLGIPISIRAASSEAAAAGEKRPLPLRAAGLLGFSEASKRYNQSPAERAALEQIAGKKPVGGISEEEYEQNRERAAAKPRPGGLGNLLESRSLDVRTIVKDVWPKMTDQERKQFRMQIRRKIGQSGLDSQSKHHLWEVVG